VTRHDREPLLHPALRELFTALNLADIAWCVLRREDRLDGTTPDVDLLIAGSQIGQAAAVLQHLGFGRIPALGHGTHSFFFTYDTATDTWIKLDIVTEIQFGPYQTIHTAAAAGLLLRREKRGDAFVLCRSDAFWCLLFHCMLDKASFDALHRQHLQQLVAAARERNPTGAGIVPEDLGEELGVRDLLAHVECERWHELEGLGHSWRREWERRQRHGTRRELKNRGLRVVGRFARGTITPGFGVALLAADGAGKTSLGRALTRSFVSPLSTRYVYMGFGGDHRRFLSYSTPGVSAMSTLARYVVVFVHLALGRIVIFDRHAYDVLLPSRRTPKVRERLHRWFLSRVHPRPDAVLILDAPGEVLHERRPEHPAEELERSRQQYLALAERLAEPVIVDASQDPEHLRREAVAQIWRLYARRVSSRAAS
jgi:hypothetical protein